MKKIFLLPLSIFCLKSFAQIDKGRTLFGGSFNFDIQQSNPVLQSNTNSNLQPFIQFAYKNNRTVGFGLDLGYNTSKSGNGQLKNRQFYIGPSVQFTQYFPLKGNFGWLLQEAVGYGYFKSRSENGNVITRVSSSSISGIVSPGVYFAAGNKKQWLLQATFGNVGLVYSKNSEDLENLSFSTSLFQHYRFGFAYIFRK